MQTSLNFVAFGVSCPVSSMSFSLEYTPSTNPNEWGVEHFSGATPALKRFGVILTICELFRVKFKTLVKNFMFSRLEIQIKSVNLDSSAFVQDLLSRLFKTNNSQPTPVIKRRVSNDALCFHEMHLIHSGTNFFSENILWSFLDLEENRKIRSLEKMVPKMSSIGCHYE